MNKTPIIQEMRISRPRLIRQKRKRKMAAQKHPSVTDTDTVSLYTRAAIQSVQKPIKLEILVSLSCTMCPELVTAAQRIAAENPHITAQVYDLNHFPDLRERYQVMSVPCLVINDGAQVSFGKKNIRQLLELLT